MKLHYVPLLQIQRDLQGLPRNYARFRQYLRTLMNSEGTGPDLVREARRLGFVKPGEQLFIVRGIAAWRAGHH